MNKPDRTPWKPRFMVLNDVEINYKGQPVKVRTFRPNINLNLATEQARFCSGVANYAIEKAMENSNA